MARRLLRCAQAGFMPYFLTLLMGALILFSSAARAVPLAQQYQQLGTATNTMVMAAVLHFVTDPRRGSSRDELALEALVTAERDVRQRAAQLGIGSSELASMLNSLEQLHNMTMHEIEYPPLLMGMLDQYEQFVLYVDQGYRQHHVSPLAELLNRQSQRIAELRLFAATRNARMLGSHSLLEESVFTRLDAEIAHGFSQLQEALPASEHKQIRQQQQAYQFVRAGLLEADSLRNSAALELYLTRMLSWLDNRAVGAEES